MYIRKQPSGGRGEYEISGEHGSGNNLLHATALLNRELLIEFGRYGYHRTANILRPLSGKKRVRLNDTQRDIHAARQVQAALLFPKSRREEIGLGGGRPTIMRERYIVREMHFEELSLRGTDEALIKLGELHLDNGSQTDLVMFSPRMKTVEHLHQNADRFPDAIRVPLVEHRQILEAAEPLDARAEDLVERLMQHVAGNAPDYNVDYLTGGDVVPVLVEMIDPPPIEEPVDIESIPPEDIDIRLREAAKRRRWLAARGPKSAKFRREVRDAYNSTCMVCGIRLPFSAFCRVPGVDSAHILPWATHDLDVVGNGLCLCKLHHWAFDQQLIAVTSDSADYYIIVTDRAKRALDALAVNQLKAHEGKVPPERLPSRSEDRPHPQLLEKLYELLGDAG